MSEALERARAQLSLVDVPAPDPAPIYWRARKLRVRNGIGASVCAAMIVAAIGAPLVALSGLGSRPETPASSPRVRVDLHHPGFSYEAGWHVLTSGSDLRGSVPLAWETNAPGFSPRDIARVGASDGTIDRNTAPVATLRTLSGNDVLIYAYFPGTSGASGPYPLRSLPLHLSQASVRTSWSSGSAPRLGVYTIRADVGGRLVNVNVYFSTPHPTAFQLRCAQQALAHLVIP